MECLKMLEKYTFLRDELKKREELVVRATKYSVIQEEVIFELRSFIEDAIAKDQLEDDPVTGLPPYSKRKYLSGYGGGKPILDRMLSKDPADKFELYNSVVQAEKAEYNSDDDDEEVKELKQEVKRYKQMLDDL